MGETRGRWHGDHVSMRHSSPAFTGGTAALFRHHRGPWFLSPAHRAASEPFVRRGTALLVELGALQCALLAGCWALQPSRECHGVQLTDQRKGPQATSAQGWCLLCLQSRPSYGPMLPTGRVKAAVHSCSHHAQGCHLVPGLQPGLVHLGTPASRDRCVGQSCCGEMKGVSPPGRAGFFTLCGLVHSSTLKAMWIV